MVFLGSSHVPMGFPYACPYHSWGGLHSNEYSNDETTPRFGMTWLWNCTLINHIVTMINCDYEWYPHHVISIQSILYINFPAIHIMIMINCYWYIYIHTQIDTFWSQKLLFHVLRISGLFSRWRQTELLLERSSQNGAWMIYNNWLFKLAKKGSRVANNS